MFEYEEMKTAGVSDYTNKTPHKHFEWIKSPCPPAVINKKISNKCAQNRRCTSSMNNHHAKFNIKKLNFFGGTDCTNLTPSKHFTEKNSKFKTPKMKKIIMKCVQIRRSTFSMYE